MEVGLWLGLGFRFRVSLVSSIFVPVEVEICGREIDLRRIQEFQEFKMSRIQEFKNSRCQEFKNSRVVETCPLPNPDSIEPLISETL